MEVLIKQDALADREAKNSEGYRGVASQNGKPTQVPTLLLLLLRL